MARLRVGDIEIDGDSIVIGGRAVLPSAPSAAGGGGPLAGQSASGVAVHVGGPAPSGAVQAGSAAATADSTPWHRLPRPSVLVGAGAAAIAAGTLGLSLVGGAMDLWTFFFSGGFLLPIGAGTIGLGLLKRRALRRALLEARELEARELAPFLGPLRALLGEQGGRQATVEWLAGRLGLPEATVVRSLALLRERGEVIEDLDVDSGEWFYALDRSQPAAALDLNARLRALESEGQSGGALVAGAPGRGRTGPGSGTSEERR